MDPILQQIIAFAQAHGLDPRALIAQMGAGGGGDPSKPAAPQMPATAPMQMGAQGQGRMPSGPIGVAVPQGMAQGMPAGMPAPQGISMGMPRDDRMASAAMAAPAPTAQINAQGSKGSWLSGGAPPSAITAKEGVTGAGGAGSMAGLASLGASLFAASKKEAPKMDIPQLTAYRYDPRLQNFKYDPNLLTGLLG